MHQLIDLLISLFDRIIQLFSNAHFVDFFKKLLTKDGFLYLLALFALVLLVSVLALGGELIGC